MGLTIPYAMRSDNNKMFNPQEALKGYDYICPCCKENLILKKGEKKVHHFSHKPDSLCNGKGALQTSLHYKAKEFFLEESKIYLSADPNDFFEYVDVKLEKKLENIIPDIILTNSNGEVLLIEITVTHGIDNEKKEKLKELGLNCFEINLSKIYQEDMELNDEYLKKWIFNYPNIKLERELLDEYYNQTSIKAEFAWEENCINFDYENKKEKLKEEFDDKKLNLNKSYEELINRYNCLVLEKEEKYQKELKDVYEYNSKLIKDLNNYIKKSLINSRTEKLKRIYEMFLFIQCFDSYDYKTIIQKHYNKQGLRESRRQMNYLESINEFNIINPMHINEFREFCKVIIKNYKETKKFFNEVFIRLDSLSLKDFPIKEEVDLNSFILVNSFDLYSDCFSKDDLKNKYQKYLYELNKQYSLRLTGLNDNYQNKITLNNQNLENRINELLTIPLNTYLKNKISYKYQDFTTKKKIYENNLGDIYKRNIYKKFYYFSSKDNS